MPTGRVAGEGSSPLVRSKGPDLRLMRKKGVTHKQDCL